jgi:type I restriction enzyme, S subunit
MEEKRVGLASFDGLCSTELMVLHSTYLDRHALLYALLTDGFIKLVDSSTFGSKMPRANWDFIGNCILPIAPPVEQQAIVGFLNRDRQEKRNLQRENEIAINVLMETIEVAFWRFVGFHSTVRNGASVLSPK